MYEARFSLLTTHFGSEFWVRELIKRVNNFSLGLIFEIVVIDQNRDEPILSIKSVIPVRVLRFARDETQSAVLGHDHPAVLQKAIDSVDFSGETLIIIDSDCLPVSPGWAEHLQKLNSPYLAGDPAKWGLTHPCFMAIPINLFKRVNFLEGVLTVGIDTGRLVGHQLASAGFPVEIDQPVRAAWGRGHYYLNGSLYHHGSGSLEQGNSRKNGFLSSVTGEYYRKKIQQESIGRSRLLLRLLQVGNFLENKLVVRRST